MPPKTRTSGTYKKGQRTGANNGIAKLQTELQELREKVKIQHQGAAVYQVTLDGMRANVTALQIENCNAQAAYKAQIEHRREAEQLKDALQQKMTQLIIEHRRETEQLRRERDKAISETRAARSVLLTPQSWL